MHEPLCEVILENLCTAVQKVQELYVSGQEVIKDCEPVNQLCQVVDEIFSHGLRERILNWASGSETTYWPLVAKITYKEVLQSISRISSVKNDRERCQVWIRIACQENSLGSYLNIITQDEKLLADFYQPHAFVFDKEKVDTAKTALLYGLSHLDFNISLDVPKNHQSSRTGSFTIPEKCHSFNGIDSSHSSTFAYTNSVASSSLSSSILKGKDASKKKKKVKSSVAVIADSLDDGVGVMNSVEKYLYNMSVTHEDTKTNIKSLNHDVIKSEQIEDSLNLSHKVKIPFERENDKRNNLDSAKDKEETSNIMKTDQFLVKSNCYDKNVSQNVEDLSSQVESCAGIEGSNLEILELGVNNVCIEEENGQNENEFDYSRDIQSTELNPDKDVGPTEKYSENSPSNDSALSFQSNEEKLSIESLKKPLQQQEQTVHNEFDYQVSRSHFKFGTPSEHCPLDDLKEENLSPEDNEEFNFVPGIHKAGSLKSQSDSFGSLTGSGSFSSQNKPETEKSRRTSTMDSKSSMSSAPDSSVPNNSWRYVTNSLADIERKDSKADDMSVATEDSFGDLVMFEELLGMNEDHFSSPESFLGLSSSEEFHHAIVSCKEMIRSTHNPEEKKKLVKQLIHLRIKQQEHKDESFSEKRPDARKILGHQFIKEQDTKALSNVMCDHCGKLVWTLWQALFTCQDCQFHSHRKCLDVIRRHCASRKVSVSSYLLNITPETGLHSQQYKCMECRKMISLSKSGQGEARLCDYSGRYFCEDCHWNDHVVIPARIVHNWDFGTYKVSRQTKQFLDLMAKKPILDLDQLNPALFKFVGELRDIKRFREEILIMKKYFMSCRSALESKLLLHLQDRQHFVDNSSSYSLQDLLEVERGTMLPFITRVHSLFLTHIKSDCELCRAKGFLCEICKANEIIFAFDPHAVQCTNCRTVFHRLCFKKDSCRKCQRIKERTSK